MSLHDTAQKRVITMHVTLHDTRTDTDITTDTDNTLSLSLILISAEGPYPLPPEPQNGPLAHFCHLRPCNKRNKESVTILTHVTHARRHPRPTPIVLFVSCAVFVATVARLHTSDKQIKLYTRSQSAQSTGPVPSHREVERNGEAGVHHR